jgi:hypothetical protein
LVPSALTGTIAVPNASSGAARSTVATSSEGTFGSPTTYDGGGVAAGTTTPATAATPGQPVDVVRHVDAVGNIDVVSRIRDLGSDDNLGHAGNVGIDGNVRLRFEQHCCIVEPDINVARHVERQHSSGNSVGSLPDRQSRG